MTAPTSPQKEIPLERLKCVSVLAFKASLLLAKQADTLLQKSNKVSEESDLEAGLSRVVRILITCRFLF